MPSNSTPPSILVIGKESLAVKPCGIWKLTKKRRAPSFYVSISISAVQTVWGESIKLIRRTFSVSSRWTTQARSLAQQDAKSIGEASSDVSPFSCWQHLFGQDARTPCLEILVARRRICLYDLHSCRWNSPAPSKWTWETQCLCISSVFFTPFAIDFRVPGCILHLRVYQAGEIRSFCLHYFHLFEVLSICRRG